MPDWNSKPEVTALNVNLQSRKKKTFSKSGKLLHFKLEQDIVKGQDCRVCLDITDDEAITHLAGKE